MRRLFAAAAVLLSLISGAQAQSGSQKTVSQLTTEVNTLWLDNTAGLINPFNARQTLLDMLQSYVPLQGGTMTGPLTVNLNAAAPILVANPPGIYLIGGDGASTGTVVSTFSVNSINVFVRANGTLGSPTRLSNGDPIATIVWRGYDATVGYSGNAINLFGSSTEDWVDATHHGTSLALNITPAGSGTISRILTVTGISGQNRFGVALETNPQSLFVVGANTATGIAASTSGITMQLIGADNANAGIEADGYGSGSPAFGGRNASGTGASPGATANNVEILRLNAFGHDGTAFTTVRSRIALVSAEAWGATNNGTFIRFYNTAIGTAAFLEQMRLQGSGGLSLGNSNVTTDLGKGQLILGGNATAPPAGVSPGVQLVSADSLAGGYGVDTFSTNGNNSFRRANGTNASPTRLSNNDVIGAMVFRGFDAVAGYSGNALTIQGFASEDWVDATHHGSAFAVNVTPAATAGILRAFTVTGVSGNNRVSVGLETNPQKTFVVSNNATTGVIGSFASGQVMAVIGADGGNAALEVQAFTNSATVLNSSVPNFGFTEAGGTAASPSNVKSTQILGQFGWRGYNGTTYTASRATIAGAAAEDFTTTNAGTYLSFNTSATGVTQPLIEQMRLQSSGGLTLGTSIVTTDNGAGNLLLAGFISTGGDARTAADFTVNNSSVLVNVTGLTTTVIAGKTYAFHSVLFTTSTSGQGVQAAIGGTATATLVIYEGQTVSSATILAQTRSAALGGAVGGVAAVAQSRIDIFGSITVNAGGTLTVQFAQQSSGATNSIVKQGSWFKVWQIQ